MVLTRGLPASFCSFTSHQVKCVHQVPHLKLLSLALGQPSPTEVLTEVSKRVCLDILDKTFSQSGMGFETIAHCSMTVRAWVLSTFRFRSPAHLTKMKACTQFIHSTGPLTTSSTVRSQELTPSCSVRSDRRRDAPDAGCACSTTGNHAIEVESSQARGARGARRPAVRHPLQRARILQ
jgi:hypothetical protein